MVKNILILRFANTFLGATWSSSTYFQRPNYLQRTLSEQKVVEDILMRFGIIRDVMQNHLLQVLTLVAMERPISFIAEDIRDEKVPHNIK